MDSAIFGLCWHLLRETVIQVSKRADAACRVVAIPPSAPRSLPFTIELVFDSPGENISHVFRLRCLARIKHGIISEMRVTPSCDAIRAVASRYGEKRISHARMKGRRGKANDKRR